MARAGKVAGVFIGTELLTGKVNTHAAFLGTSLLDAGLRLIRETTVSDDVADISSAIIDGLRSADAVIVAGGLGPTFDDVTREAAARALGRKLIYRPELFSEIKARLRRHGHKTPEENKRQAFVIDGAAVLKNDLGSAPGQIIAVRGKTLVLLPGPFFELEPMFKKVLPVLRRRHAAGRPARASFHLCGLMEAEADELLEPVLKKGGDGVDFTILAGAGQVDFHARSSIGRDPLRKVSALIDRAVGKYVFGTNGTTLEKAVGELLKRKGCWLATAESCTGGLLSARLTNTPGSSAYFKGGVISYADEIKERELDVLPETLARHGAVSEAVAREMAEGARKRLKADFALSITGIAGPQGGTAKKPVGTTYIGLAVPGCAPQAAYKRFSGNREQIRARAVTAALTLLWKALRS